MTSSFAEQLERYRAENDERLERLRPADTIKGLFIRHYLELCEQLGGEGLRARCNASLGEGRIFDFIDYPYASLVRMGTVASAELVPRYPGVEAWLEDMGRLATSGYLQSALGRAFLRTFSPSPRSMLVAMPWAIRSTFGFGQRTVDFPDEGRCVFSCRRDFSPAESNAGAVKAAIEAVGAREVAVRIERFDLFNYDLHVSWS